MKKLLIILSLILVTLLSGCVSQLSNVSKTSETPKIDIGQVEHIDSEKYGLVPMSYSPPSTTGLYMVGYSKAEDEKSLVLIGYGARDDVFLECPDFNLNIIAEGKENEALVSELKTKITCADLRTEEVTIPLVNFKHVSQIVVDEAAKAGIESIAGNFASGTKQCTELYFKGKGGSISVELSECVGDFEKASNGPSISLVTGSTESTDYTGGTFAKGQKGSRIGVFYAKKCSETNYIRIISVSNVDSELLVKAIADELNC